MAKRAIKSHPQKGQKKKHGLLHHLLSYLFLTAVAVVSFGVTTSITFHPSSPSFCANSKSCTSDLSLHIDNNLLGMFQGKVVQPPTISQNQTPATHVLGASTAPGEKHIYVSLATQTLYAFQGSTLVLKTLVSTGKWNPTPVGNFHIWEKLRSTRMTGGEGADAYDLPNVPYVMYFYHDFGLHGAYWHDNFGHMMSHGCVNMREVDAKALFEWADGPTESSLGTAVSICDEITGTNQCIQNNPVQ